MYLKSSSRGSFGKSDFVSRQGVDRDYFRPQLISNLVLSWTRSSASVESLLVLEMLVAPNGKKTMTHSFIVQDMNIFGPGPIDQPAPSKNNGPLVTPFGTNVHGKINHLLPPTTHVHRVRFEKMLCRETALGASPP